MLLHEILTEAAESSSNATLLLRVLPYHPMFTGCRFEQAGPSTIVCIWLKREGEKGLLENLTRLADAFKVTLVAHVTCAPDVDFKRLIAHYRNHGFRLTDADFDPRWVGIEPDFEPEENDVSTGTVELTRLPGGLQKSVR